MTCPKCGDKRAEYVTPRFWTCPTCDAPGRTLVDRRVEMLDSIEASSPGALIIGERYYWGNEVGLALIDSAQGVRLVEWRFPLRGLTRIEDLDWKSRQVNASGVCDTFKILVDEVAVYQGKAGLPYVDIDADLFLDSTLFTTRQVCRIGPFKVRAYRG